MNPRLPRLTAKEALQAFKRAGFIEWRQRGSHLHLKRLSDNRRVTILMHPHRIIPSGTLRAIIRDAGLSVDDFIALL